MTLELSPDQLQAIKVQAERTYPEECCGLLLGRLEEDRKLLVEVRSTENTWDPQVADDLSDTPLTKSRRYWIAPEEMLAAMRYARSHALDVIGIYHSHPNHPAVPSECDRRLAWPQYSYLIVSVEQGTATACNSWILDDRHQFQPENLLIVESTEPEGELNRQS